MLCFASVFNIIVFYYAFKEKIRALHSVGVALMFISIVCIGIAAATADEDEDELDPATTERRRRSGGSRIQPQQPTTESERQQGTRQRSRR